jgi:hypothetical protein
MEPVSVVALITAAIPFVTALAKKFLNTERLPEKPRKGIHALLPVLLGVLSSGIYAYSQGKDWLTALAIGLGSGGAASSVRDIDKNLTQIGEILLRRFFVNRQRLS